MTLLFKLSALIPLFLMRSVGLAMGWLVWLVSSRYRRLHRANWQLAIDSGRLGLDTPQLRARYSEAIGHGGLLAAELPKLWCDQSVVSKTRLVGLQDWQDAVNEGKGVLLLTPHLGAFELIPRVLAQHGPITVLYRPARQAAFRRLMETLRPVPGVETAPATGAGVRQLLRTLRQGHTVGMLPDQVPSGGEGQWADFFGKPAYTMTLPIRLIQSTGAAVIWGLVTRTQGGWCLRLERWRPPLDLGTASLSEALAAMNAGLENQIAQAPEQYLWAYNRFKRPKLVAGSAPKASQKADP